MTGEGKQISILVADENAIFRRGLFAVLTAREHFRVVGLAAGPEEVRRKAAELRPDVVVVHLNSARPSLDLIGRLVKECPGSRVLALGEEQPGAAEEAFKAGAAGYVLRSAGEGELWQAVEAIHRGEVYLTPASRRLMERYLARTGGAARRGSRPLTAREREILRLIAEGMSNKEAAAALGISVRTVENHRASIMKKLDLHSVADLVKYAISCGLVAVEQR